MKAFILAAGVGSRLRPLTDSRPKVMLEIAGKKILERTIEQLKKTGIKDFVINVHYLPSVITEFFGNGEKFGVTINYSLEEELLGTAGAVKKVQAQFEKEKEFLLVYGDNIFDVDFEDFVKAPQLSTALIMLFHRHTNPNSKIAGDVVELDETGKVLAFWKGVEKSHPHVNGGVYKLTPEIFKHIPENTFYDFAREVFPSMLKNNHEIHGFVIHPKHAIFGGDTIESLELTRKYFEK